MTAKERILALACLQIGYVEKYNTTDLDSKTAYAGSGNYTKFARDLDAISGFYNGKKNGYAWCDIFVDWLFVKCFGADAATRILHQPWGSAGAGCTYSLDYYRRAGAFYTKPEAGDQIFFGAVGNSVHTGIVESVTETTVTTIEGNTSDRVARRTYSIHDGNIAGYGRPDWALAEKTAAGSTTAIVEPEEITAATTQSVPATITIGCVITVPELEKGSQGDAVKTLQRLLNAAGCSVGVFGIDGDFGIATEKALIKYQNANGLDPDGICGSKTWTKIIGG